MFFFVL
jgi:hypothetical protein